MKAVPTMHSTPVLLNPPTGRSPIGLLVDRYGTSLYVTEQVRVELAAVILSE